MMRVFFAVFFTLLAVAAFAQFHDEELGDSAIAHRYAAWVAKAIVAGQWEQARAGLGRASDFIDVSSDISYQMALVLSHDNESRAQILAVLANAIHTGLWSQYTEAQARFMQAGLFIAMRRYTEALDTLAVRRALVGDDADSAMLRLEALKGLAMTGQRLSGVQTGVEANLPLPAEFRHRILETMDRYPRDTRPLRILFDYARWREPSADDIPLIELALRRLPFVLESDPGLAWMAAYFTPDMDDARRLVASYRSGTLLAQAGGFLPNPASIAPALNLGLVDDIDAVDELFLRDTLDRDIIVTVGDLLRSEDGRDYLAQQLHAFTGTITEDEDRDGIPENRAVYRQGVLTEYHSDFDQDRIADLSVWFDFGRPQRAELAGMAAAGEIIVPALIHWERHPFVLNIALGHETFHFAPGSFPFPLITYEDLCATDTYNGLLFPRADPLSPGITRRMLTSFAAAIHRPSTEFEGGIEYIQLERGIPVRAEVTLGDMIVAITEYENGIPVLRRFDLDLDGHMEIMSND